MARRIYEEVLRRVRGKRDLMTMIRRRQISFMGHRLRGSSLEKVYLLGMIDGRRPRGRQRRKFMHGWNKRRDWMLDHGGRAQAGQGQKCVAIRCSLCQP